MKNRITRCMAALFSASLIFILAGCSVANTEPISTTAILFDTVISIELYGTKDTAILDDCISMCQDYEDRFSRTIDTSEISQINNAHGAAVTVSDDTIELIQKGLDYGRLSNGYFDITIAPLSSLWDFKNNTGVVPDASAIEEAKSHVNYQNVIINGNTVTLTDPKAAIDLGGIAKGYIADQLKALIEAKDVEHGIISLGGNVLTIGSKIDGSAYHIGIQKPFDESTAITSVDVKDKSVVSSGVYERYFKVDNKLYHHILNPFTGFPYDNNLLGVTIISDQSVDGDALSTTCFALGLDEGTKLIDSLDNIEAVFITDDYELHQTGSNK
ncbi:MAG: FAD:protein FMN transferase [Hespellia sp.]|nr:FAD:protein FMN transferase [Hespellia sp.]